MLAHAIHHELAPTQATFDAMSLTKVVLLSLGAVVLLGVAVLFISWSFISSLFTNSYEIKNGKVLYHVAGIGLSEVTGADAETFREMRAGNHGFGEDKHGIYFHTQRLPGVDRDSFVILSEASYWSKDKNTVFYGADVLPEVDASRFRLLSPYYGTDGKSVYSGGRLIAGADPETFELVGKDGTMARDKNAWYRHEERGHMKNGTFVSDEEEAEDAESDSQAP
ncbi:DKNYY domain-containing protein [Pyxidicoccus parkwayensis]|uniref:DKNYY domain-containing protein n=1 Tax=Pyxidicoccus parkwayensis TaxID=2813578 RepID=A0ABX7NLM4_9BACT|nr:DKNYY domain-containing protein [Pyxidicoccus parkwaysis]QSQ19533.1 DKNYY domain-containing protein [Pyxidicoccus parkwaysis]